ncbi:hypothetical protein LY76DRAFT_428656 [Colletotrichum caudatum]|nr:hypothetical protein LY76DRAFT_428656 [Colletotrichum caudatum]
MSYVEPKKKNPPVANIMSNSLIVSDGNGGSIASGDINAVHNSVCRQFDQVGRKPVSNEPWWVGIAVSDRTVLVPRGQASVRREKRV